MAVPAEGKQFGFSANMHKEDLFIPGQEAATVALAGASGHRMAVDWKWIQYEESDPPLPVSYDGDAGMNLRHLDERYAALLAAGIRPIIHVSRAPLWSSRFGACRDGDLACRQEARKAAAWTEDGYYFPDQAHMPALRALHVALAKRYTQADFEGWNEPNIYYDSPPDRPYEPWAPGPEELRHIQCAAYWAVKSVDRGRLFIGPSFLYRNWSHYADYVNRVFAAGGHYCWDGYNTHAYVDGETDLGARSWFARIFAAARRMRSYHGDRDPIWVTEAGWPTSGHTWYGEPWVTPEAQADIMGRLYNRLMTMPDVAGAFLHTLRDAQIREHDDPQDNFGLLNADLTPKPAFCVFVQRSAHAYPGC